MTSLLLNRFQDCGLWLQLLAILVWTGNWFSLDPSFEISTELLVPQHRRQKECVRLLPKTLISPQKQTGGSVITKSEVMEREWQRANRGVTWLKRKTKEGDKRAPWKSRNRNSLLNGKEGGSVKSTEKRNTVTEVDFKKKSFCFHKKTSEIIKTYFLKWFFQVRIYIFAKLCKSFQIPVKFFFSYPIALSINPTQFKVVYA